MVSAGLAVFKEMSILVWNAARYICSSVLVRISEGFILEMFR